MAKGDLTRSRILKEAAEQATVRGLSAVSLMDVAEQVGLSKSGVFKHFQSKEALQQALVESVIGQFEEKVWRPAEPLPRGEPRLRMLVEKWLDWVDGEISSGGCGLTAFAIELDDQPGQLREHLRWQQSCWQRILTSEFARLREPQIDREIANQAAFELKAMVLGYNHHKRLLDVEQARAMVMRAVEGLVERTAAA
jgi:AcrR family transcriptional regulator